MIESISMDDGKNERVMYELEMIEFGQDIVNAPEWDRCVTESGDEWLR